MIPIILVLALTAGTALALPQEAGAPVSPKRERIQQLDEESPPLPPILLSPEALCLRGEHFLDDAGRAAAQEARRIFETAVKFYPEAACGHSGVARSLLTLYHRRIEQDDALIGLALSEARKAVGMDPNSGRAQAALAGALLADLQLDSAEDAADTALSLSPDDVPALQIVALVRMTGGHFEAARTAMEHALELRPDLPVSHHTLGNAQFLLGQRAEAMDSYRNALRLSPDFAPSKLQVAASYEALGHHRAAGQVFQEVLEDHPEETSRVYLYMGESLMRRNSWANALLPLGKADFKTHRGLSNGTVLYLKAHCYERLGREQEARAAFREVIDQWPDATAGLASGERLIFASYEGLGRLYLKARDTEQAQAVMEEGIARTHASLGLYLKLAALYKDYGLPDRASALLEQAVARDLDPKNASMLLSAYLIGMRLAVESNDRTRLDRLIQSLDGQSARLIGLHDYLHDLEAMRAYSIAGRGDRALDILKRCLDTGSAKVEWITNDPDLEGLRSTEGFKEIARSAGLPVRPSH